MSKVVYISKSSIEPKRGPLRIAHLPGEPQPECSYTQRAKSFDSGGRKKLQPSGIAGFGLRADSSRPAPSRFWVAQEKT
jgi:hypothetical protein